MPVLTGKLGASVNGPEGLPRFDGDAWTPGIVWTGGAMRSRYGGCAGGFFKAVRDGDWPRARNLQELTLRSWSNTLVSVVSKGSKTHSTFRPARTRSLTW
jgi:hypothetical protein